MGLRCQLTRGLRVLGDRAQQDREIADEVESFLAESTAAAVTQGLSADEARRWAERELGNLTSVKEQVRSYGWENAVEATFTDLRLAVRRLRRTPGITLLAVLTLALGLGAATAIWSVVSPILLQALPYPHAERLVMVWEVADDGSRVESTYGAYRALEERRQSFESLAVMRTWQPAASGGGEPERLDGQRVSARYFEVLGVRPARGRGFEAADDRRGAPRVVLLSDGLWRRRFGADAAIVGRSISLDGGPFTVAGVLPATFENVLAPGAEVWTPLQYDLTLPQAWGHHLRTIGRLQRTDTERTDIQTARRDLARLSETLVREHSRGEVTRRGLTLDPMQEDVTRAVRPALLAILGAVLLVLLIACVNVTHLLLGRAIARRGELALRAALGAGRRRIVRQLVTESLLLAVLGGTAGLGVAALGVRSLLMLRPAALPRVGAIVLDARVFALGFGLATLVGLACGLVPALAATRERPGAGLQHASARTAGGHRRARRLLVVAEVAVALVLAVGSGLLLRSLQRLLAVDLGFAPAHVLTLQLQTSGQRFADDAARRRFLEHALQAVRGVPGVDAAAFTSQLPLSGDAETYGVRFESSRDDAAQDGGAFRYAVSPGYLETLRIPLRAGRTLDTRDQAEAPPVALINESFARRKFPDRDPLGQRLQVGSSDGPWYSIVGVVADVKQMSLAARPADAVYVPAVQWSFVDQAPSFVVRARGAALALLPAVRAAVWSVDTNQPVARVASMETLVAGSAAERRFALVLFEAFALLALLLAAVGIYGVLAGSVAERRRELGVRSALGATRGELRRMVLRQGMGLTALGAGLGLLGAAAASRVLTALLFDTSRIDPATYLGVVTVVFAVSAVACWAPASRASRVDPAITLRAD